MEFAWLRDSHRLNEPPSSSPLLRLIIVVVGPLTREHRALARIGRPGGHFPGLSSRLLTRSAEVYHVLAHLTGSCFLVNTTPRGRET